MNRPLQHVEEENQLVQFRDRFRQQAEALPEGHPRRQQLEHMARHADLTLQVITPMNARLEGRITAEQYLHDIHVNNLEPAALVQRLSSGG